MSQKQYTGAEIAAHCDHTLLKADATYNRILEICEEAKQLGTAAVCVNPVHAARVHAALEGSGIRTAVVVGFPLGANKPEVKAFETKEAIRDGADEVDMVINVGALRSGDTDTVLRDIEAVVQAARAEKPETVVKVIIETCYLSDEEKKTASALCEQAGADYVKTSTGFGTGGATLHDVALIHEVIGDRLRIKASGGISNREDAVAFLEAGADRLGVSRTKQIIG
ncbi:MAG: deoxyribose-phosphate aldolase [Mogibacterium sp.]|nr:deoxyribose-phosphate aldolase [Mogibacterium sp.]